MPHTKAKPVAPVEPSDAKAVDFCLKSTAFALFFDNSRRGRVFDSITFDPVRRFNGSIFPLDYRTLGYFALNYMDSIS